MDAGEIIIKTKLVVDDFKKSLNSVKDKVVALGKGLTKIVLGIGKTIIKTILGLGSVGALLGGMSVGALILGKAFEKVFENEEQIRANIQYIIFAISKALEPAIDSVAGFIQKILNLIIQIVRYTALFINLWFGKNVFAEATADNFAKSMAEAEKSTKKTAKNAKEIKKQLAGFDEMNVLSDNSGGATSGGGTVAPSFDLSNLEDLQVPEWMLWIVQNKDIVIAGLLGIATGLLAVQLGLTGIFGGIIVALIVALVALIIQNWDTIKEILGEVWSWIDENIIQPVVALFVWLWDKIVEIFGPVVSFFFNIYSKIFQGIINIITTIWTNITTIIGNIIQIVSVLWNTIINILKPIATWIWNNVLIPVLNFFKRAIDTIWGLIRTIATTAGDVIGGTFKAVINGVLNAVETILNFPIKSINKLIKTINEVPGINLKTLSTFKLPRLAKGGIVSMPGRGVPIGNAIVGERGQEAVLPLTDSQQMALLGEAIGRYININANIPVYVGNRQIAREMRRINAEDDFAFNR